MIRTETTLNRFIFFMLLTLALLISACNTNIQERSFESYLCEVNADGSGFRTLRHNDYSMTNSGLAQNPPTLKEFPYLIQYANQDLLLVFRDDGCFRYNPQRKVLEPIGDNIFAYMSNTSLHPTSSPDLFLAVYGNSIYQIFGNSLDYSLLQSAVASATSIPFSDYISILDPEGMNLATYQDGSFSNNQIQLPQNALRAFYFSGIDASVYITSTKIMKYQSEAESVLYPFNSSVVRDPSFYPVNVDGLFLTNIRIESDEHLLLINADDESVQDLGIVHYPRLPNDLNIPIQLSFTSDRSKFLYFDSTAMYIYDLHSHTKETVLVSSPNNHNLRNISSACISPDGNKISFICDIYKYQD